MKTALQVSLLIVVFGVALFALPEKALAASLSLSPASASKNNGETFGVDIVLDTEGAAVSGATAIINYDTGKLQVQDDDSNNTGVNIKPGTALSQVLSNSVDTSAGKIRFDAGNLGASYTGRGVLATIQFKAIGSGVAQASFLFNPSSTTNTSQVAAATGPTNLLTKINDGNYTIGGTSSNSTSSTQTQQTLPQTGVMENTIAILVGGLGLLGMGMMFGRMR